MNVPYGQLADRIRGTVSDLDRVVDLWSKVRAELSAFAAFTDDLAASL